MRLLKSLPWLGTRQWTSSWTMTASRNVSGCVRRSVLKQMRPEEDQEAHFLVMR